MSSIQNRLKEKLNSFRKEYGKIGFWAVFAMVMPIIGLSALLGVIYEISPWIKSNPTLSVPAFVLTISILSGLAILPTNIVGVTSGWAFGFPLGLLTMLSAIGGAVAINFFISKRLAGRYFKQVIKEKPKIDAIHKALLAGNAGKVILIIVLLRLSPATPFAATNFMLSASGVPIRAYLLGTVLGYIPRTSATVFVGSSLSQLNFEQPQESWLIILGIIATIIATVVIGVLSKRALNRLTAEQCEAV